MQVHAMCAPNMNAKYDRDGEVVLLTGTTSAPNSFVTAEVLKPGESWENLSDDILSFDTLEYVHQVKSDENGNFEMSFGVKSGTGVYQVRIYSESDGEYAYDNTLKVIDRESVDELVSEIAGATAERAKEIICDADNAEILGLDITDIVALTDAERTQFFGYFAAEAKALGIKTVSDIEAALSCAKIIRTVNGASAEELAAFVDANIDKIGLGREQSINIYSEEKYFPTERKAPLYVSLAAKDYQTVGEFSAAFGDGVLLYSCYDRENYHIIESIFADSAVFAKLYTGKYASLSNKADALKAVNALKKPAATTAKLAQIVKEASEPKSSSGGSSSSSGSKGSSSVISIGTGTTVPEKQKDAFSDMENFSWAKEAVDALSKAGIVSGKAEGQFCPADNVTREEFIKMLVSALGETAIAEKTPFTDVADGAWYEGYIASAVRLGIASGISEDCFGVAMPITRQDMAAIAYRAVGGKIDGSRNAEFSDNDDIAEYARDACAKIGGAGIISGMGDGSFAPREYVTRTQAALIYRIYKLINA